METEQAMGRAPGSPGQITDGGQLRGSAGSRPLRALRGLALGLTFSFVNLIGAFVTLLALGGLGEWTRLQFVGFFGVLEMGTGLAFLIAPNIWRMPVAEAKTSDRTEIHLAASAVLIPHWMGGTKAVAGAALLLAALAGEGVGPYTLGLPVLVLALATMTVAVSMLTARFGVARPDLDVMQFIIRRPNLEDRVLPAFSLGSTFVQALLSMLTIPVIKLLKPGFLYQPEVGPSGAALAAALLLTAALTGLALLAWRGRIAWRAPAEQQADAEAA